MRLLTILTLSVMLVGCGRGFSSGTGKKIGQVIQLGKHGLFCDTYEGRLVRGGFNTGSGVSGRVFDFTVLDETLFRELNIAMEKQQELEISYEQVILSGPCTSESTHFVTHFRVLSETTPGVEIRPQLSEKDRRKQELLKQLQDLEK